MTFQDVVSIGWAIVVSVGGAGAIVVALAHWTGKLWADRFVERQKGRIAEQLEVLKSQQRQLDETLQRKRDLYDELLTAMRVFIAGSTAQNDLAKRKDAFLRSYDRCYLWAPDAVVRNLGCFLDVMADFVATGDMALQPKMKSLLSECLISMRKDCGFQDTTIVQKDYRFVSF